MINAPEVHTVIPEGTEYVFKILLIGVTLSLNQTRRSYSIEKSPVPLNSLSNLLKDQLLT